MKKNKTYKKIDFIFYYGTLKLPQRGQGKKFDNKFLKDLKLIIRGKIRIKNKIMI